MWLIISIGFLFIPYAGLLYFYYTSWEGIPDVENNFIFDNYKNPNISFSVIVPARNEEKNIEKLLYSLTLQSYPNDLFEVIVIDDHSTDETAFFVNRFKEKYSSPTIYLLQLQHNEINSYKKKAIELGIQMASNAWIVCTDADCIVPPYWISTIAACITTTNPVLIASPVRFNEAHTLLHIFQTLDFLTLQGITGASVYKKLHAMCNGANLAYKREVFYEVGAFKGIDNIASGDDMLLMHKIWESYPNRIQYIKSRKATVITEAAPTWNEFFNQRIRWASKAKNYDDKKIILVLLLVYFINCSFLILLIAGFFNFSYFYVLLIFWILKTMIELPFMRSAAAFFGKRHLIKYFFFFQPLHIAYTIIAGFLGSFGNYSWKGRRVK